MAHVIVTVNNVSYTLACDDGEEAHLAALAKQFDKRVAEVKKEARNASEAQLLLMAGCCLKTSSTRRTWAMRTNSPSCSKTPPVAWKTLPRASADPTLSAGGYCLAR